MASRLKEDSIVNKSNETEDLLVFGYSCKLFRDDEKALYIDQGKHLIPWMGDETLKIDRYDARGTLFDLSQLEAPSGGFDRFFGLTDVEKQVETMCDEERYRALVTNEEEETMYQEEELKRLHYAINDKGNSYSQVEYKYEGETTTVEEAPEKPQVGKIPDSAEDEPFVPSPQLDLPVNMVLPETMKHNAIIEKTAMFISNQGPQMEILLKMKQAGNPQFNFLSFDNPLHSYYRHLLMAIKAGRYKPDPENGSKKPEVENDEEDHYLHPSLASSVSKVELAPSIPSINYKPSAHCAYSMLVNKIKDKKAGDQSSSIEKQKDGNKEENGTERDISRQTFTTPPKDMQIIIDKMASCVAKHGRDFETVVQMKNDPRFDFLNSAHVHNPYYQFKIKHYEILEKSSRNKAAVAAKSKEDQSKNKLAPVCFSIKKPKDSEPVIEKSALPVEESSDEEGKEGQEEKEKEGAEENVKEEKEDVVTIDLAAIEEKEEKNKKILATERLKDKLTVAAREKMAMATKEKQLQLERKRRAAAFLKIIHSDPKVPVPFGPQLPDDKEENSDVASLPDAADDVDDRRKNSNRRERREKRHRSSYGRHSGSREKRRSKSEKEKTVPDDRGKEGNERVMESSLSSDEDEKRKRRSDESYHKSKLEKSRGYREEEKRHKRKKHKKEEMDRSSRKRSKLKRSKRSRKEEDGRSKRSRRESSSSSSDCQNSLTVRP